MLPPLLKPERKRTQTLVMIIQSIISSAEELAVVHLVRPLLTLLQKAIEFPSFLIFVVLNSSL